MAKSKIRKNMLENDRPARWGSTAAHFAQSRKAKQSEFHGNHCNDRLMCLHFWLFICLLLPLTSCAETFPPPLPEARSNNPTVRLAHPQGNIWATLTGLGAGKTWRDIQANGFWWREGDDHWRQLPSLPDGQGRLAAQMTTANGDIWFFGGYTVAEDGSEVSTPQTYRVRPWLEQPYQRFTDMPVPVDDAVALTYQNRYIYLISGWHDVGNVNLVQVYDTELDRWQQAEPWPGAPVFGHAGGIINNLMLICGGAKIEYSGEEPRQFVISDACWLGGIRADNPRRIDWQPIAMETATSRYRAAAVGYTFDQHSYFAMIGGTNNPYNYNGIGYDGTPSTPLASIDIFDPGTKRWHPIQTPAASMDHRNAIWTAEQKIILIGGMNTEQRVLSSSRILHPEILNSRDKP